MGGVDTAFFARPSGLTPQRPTIALLAEYDALPKIGHGCGHNMIAAATMGAALGLQQSIGDLAAGLVVVGTPAEEGGGGKVLLAEAGIFEGIDAALMFHPASTNLPAKNSLGRIKYKVEFFGQTAHASGSPDKGRNALDGLVLAYTGMNAMRQYLRPNDRLHGIITHGGDAPNIIPDYAAGMFYVRSDASETRDDLFERVQKCIQGAAQATGTEAKVTVSPPKLDPLKRNAALESAITANMAQLGITIDADDGRKGSSDIGNLSHYLPAAHPYLAIVDADEGIPGHSVGFCDATVSARGQAVLVQAAKLLALSAYDYLTSAELQAEVRRDFEG